jgi:hypothetical protein
VLRALYHATARLYYRWALNGIHPAHPDAGYVQLMHAVHSIELERFLQGRS